MLRAFLGSDPLLVCWLPLALATEGVLLLRSWLNVRDRVVSTMLVSTVVALCLSVDGWLHEIGFVGSLWREVLLGSGYAALSALILFPILDTCKPLLRSYSYPL